LIPAGERRPVCLLGGSGFVGRRLAARLSADGIPVRVPTRRPSSAAHPSLRVLPGVTLVTVDVRDPAMLRVLLAGCDSAVNLVGILNESGRDGSGFDSAHRQFTADVVAACNATPGLRRLVQISALKADAELGPSHYLRSKGAAERAIAEGAIGFDWTILQPSVIFGRGDSFLNRFAGLLRMVPGLFPLARAGAQFAPVHVDDVVAAIRQCLDDPATAGRTLELCGPEVYSLRELVERVAMALGLRRRVIGLPDWLARAQALVMERLPGKPFSMDNYRSLTMPSVCIHNGFAELGLTPRSLELNLQEALGKPRAARALNSYRRTAGR
jgi:NADH dehydrogenase